MDKINKVFTNSINLNNNEINIDQSLIFECECKVNKNSKKTNHTSSTCSSRSSNTNDNDNDSENQNDSDSGSEDGSSQSGSCSTASEDEIFISINEFPVNITALEACRDTLDQYITNNEKIKDDEWDSIVIQILMMLITYQKVFIIDFGRAIYSFKGKTLCSDSYHKDGDAATLYNFGIYEDKSKPIINPNFSFDLARLGCSIFDFFVEELDDLDKIKSNIKKIILGWCIDDKDRNILYKNNGQERYPDFKLYKMIARTVHKHIPEKVLQNPYFDKYLVAKKNINKKNNIMNIDDYPNLS
jgi:hypothetical protein